jgi:hypothetical protein
MRQRGLDRVLDVQTAAAHGTTLRMLGGNELASSLHQTLQHRHKQDPILFLYTSTLPQGRIPILILYTSTPPKGRI